MGAPCGTRQSRYLPATRVSALHPFLTALDQTGLNAAVLLERARIDTALLRHTNAILPLRACLRFLDIATREAGNPLLGVDVSLATPIESLGPYGRRLRRSRTLAEYLIQGVERYNQHTSGLSLELEVHEGHWRIVQPWVAQLGEPRGQSLAHLNTLAVTISSCRAAAGCNWTPPAANISVHCADRSADCGLFEATDLHQAGQDTWIDIPLDMLGRPMWGNHDEGKAGDMLSPLRETLIDCVRQQIHALIDRSDLSLPTVAASLGISARTIQRHLGREGLSFSGLHEQCRYQIATSLLANEDIPVIDIAYDLGYTDPSNFTRAFRRWSGVCPADFRTAVRGK